MRHGLQELKITVSHESSRLQALCSGAVEELRYAICVLQHVAACCSMLQRVAMAVSCRVLQFLQHTPRYVQTATHCYTLQHTALHSNTLQHTATHCDALLSIVHSALASFKVRRPQQTCPKQSGVKISTYLAKETDLLLITPQSGSQSISHCNNLQHTTTHCNTLQRTATLHNALQRTATQSV